ncbi:alpha/beta-hydrolase [Lophium mytilinum]|uniref:Alpha/beta-hydrolase n=1 Tax=Lophium mytilinum TaxID=390894 RepID=A0A6A6QHL5_9PEZI|nr:alpha/beta-hydrolase [Lophium mytilinum]
MFNVLDNWVVTNHVIPASWPRGFARGVRDEESGRLRLAVNEYVPRANMSPQPGDVTFLFAHGTGSTKESYEPFFDDVLTRFPRIRAIWAFDIAWHGASYLLNEHVIGDEPDWFDCVRDILHIANHFQRDLHQPMVGMGQSWGCFNILLAAVHNPRIFAGIIALEPVLVTGYKTGPPHMHIAFLMMKRRDRWLSREYAKRALRKSPYYAVFDDRVFDQIIRYDLRDVPLEPQTAQGASAASSVAPEVTLTTPKAMEAYTMMRANPPLPGYPPGPDHNPNHSSHSTPVIPGFHRAADTEAHRHVPHVLPPVLYVWGSRSYIAKLPGYRQMLVEQTGIGPGGSGGAPAGHVTETVIGDCGHCLPFEKPHETAKALQPWLKQHVDVWGKHRRERKKEGPYWTDTINPGWIERASKISKL